MTAAADDVGPWPMLGVEFNRHDIVTTAQLSPGSFSSDVTTTRARARRRWFRNSQDGITRHHFSDIRQ